MDSKKIADFISKATDYSICSEHDERVRGFQRDYDRNDDGCIELPEFLEFYLNASINKKSTVFDNLRSLGYGKDLRLKVDENQADNFDYRDSIRYKLVVNGDAYIKTILRHFETMSIKCTQMNQLKKSEATPPERLDYINKNIRLMIRWSNVFKTFVYTMPPSISVIEDILFSGVAQLEDLNEQGQIGFYKLIVLFGILFKPKKIFKILQIISQSKVEVNTTSNDDLKQSGWPSEITGRRGPAERTQKGPLGRERRPGPQAEPRADDRVAGRGRRAGNHFPENGNDGRPGAECQGHVLQIFEQVLREALFRVREQKSEHPVRAEPNDDHDDQAAGERTADREVPGRHRPGQDPGHAHSLQPLQKASGE